MIAEVYKMMQSAQFTRKNMNLGSLCLFDKAVGDELNRAQYGADEKVVKGSVPLDEKGISSHVV